MNNIENQLKDIGIVPKMSLEVHSSYKKIGMSITPEAIIKSLKNVITVEGNIAMAAFPLSKKMTLTDDDKRIGIFSKSKWLPEDHNERTDMGIISDTFKLSENVLTGRGQHRMSAWGRKSKEIVEDFNYLINNNGYALLIGVDIRKLTSMHYVEHCLPNDIWPLLFSKMNPEIMRIYNLDEYFITTEEIPKYHKGWLYIQSIAEKENKLIYGKLGNADCIFFRIKDVISIYENEIQTNLSSLFDIEYLPA
jgi:aminoglycoside N3'-acetyltransferase